MGATAAVAVGRVTPILPGHVVRVAFAHRPMRHALNARLLKDRSAADWRTLVVLAVRRAPLFPALIDALNSTRGMPSGSRVLEVNRAGKERPTRSIQVLSPDGAPVWIPADWAETTTTGDIAK